MAVIFSIYLSIS